MPANILSIDVEDWFHILALPGTPPVEQWRRLESRVERGLRRILDLLDERNARATFFFLGWIAENHPDLVRACAARGHEIASHGYGHRLVYTQSRAEFGEDVRRTKACLEEITHAPVHGYRAPGFSIVRDTPWAFDEILEAGYTYDSSIFPARRGHGGLPGAPLHPYVHRTASGSLVEFPVTVASFLGVRVCFFGGGYFRLFPYPLIRRMSRVVAAEGRPVVYYLHPREFDPSHPRLSMGPWRRFKSYVNLRTAEPKLRALLAEEELTTFAEWMRSDGAQLASGTS